MSDPRDPRDVRYEMRRNVSDDERTVLDSYERVPYRSSAQHLTHPDRLAAVAILHGLEPARVEECRVLELGCADGGNLIPMAVELPRASFTGIDLSPRQIETARAEAGALGLQNIDLRVLSILDAGANLGTFDFIICHGVYSWVPRRVQEQIFALCRSLLAPDGVAYISYNTLPGWHMRQVTRDMLLFHARGTNDPDEQVRRSYELIELLSESVGETNDAHSLFLRSAREHLHEYVDRPHYLMHEYFEEHNIPVYFHDFATDAMRHGLQYLADAEPHVTEVDNLTADVATKLRSFSSSRIELEQYLDFVVNRMFRRTLLCHAEAKIDREMRPERIARLSASTAARPSSPTPDLRAGTSEGFITEREKSFSSSHPMAKGLLVSLASIWPSSAPYAALADDLHRRLGRDFDPEVLPDLLWSLYWSGVVELHAFPPSCTSVPGDYPRASPLARRQAAAGPYVTTQRRRVIKLDDPIALFLLPWLDGTRDRAALVRLLDREIANGRLDLSDGRPLLEPHKLPAVLQAVVERHLRKMAEYALLV